MMHALVVYESMFGNTRDLAQAIADGLSTQAEVEVVEVGGAPAQLDADVGLLVVGGPTHAFSMSRPSTRSDAATKATEPVVSRGIGVREWLEGLGASGKRAAGGSLAAATFDTRATSPLSGSAARGAQKRLRRAGCHLVSPATNFFVSATTGPLVAGELERAKSWGAELGRLAQAEETSGKG